jgi:hypothetical protein
METEGRYTIAELADASAAALDALGIAARNGQVRDRPDARTIRYYSALGLVDRPTEMTGRTAQYGDRHLLQVLAVKALQARGATLADVQRSLVGASESELRTAVGPGLPAALAAAAGPPPGRPDPAFWRTPPTTAPVPSATAAPLGAALSDPAPSGTAPSGTAPSGTAPSGTAPSGAGASDTTTLDPVIPETASIGPGPSGTAPPGAATMLAASAPPSPARAARRARAADGAMQPRQLISVPLAEGATLLIEHADSDAVDVGALLAAAAPLLAHLTDAGLLPGSPTHPGAIP